jgi:hypothetical protein
VVVDQLGDAAADREIDPAGAAGRHRKLLLRQLDSRYTDADGDMVADIPTDPAQLVDPDTLIFAYTPVEDPAVYAEVWADFLDHMER